MYKILPILLFAYGLAITTEDIYVNSYALIIGISEYQNVSNLNYGASDAETIQNLLISQFDFPEENTRLLINEDATKNNIRRAYLHFLDVIKEHDRLLIYFSGHGATESLPDGGEKGYLMAVDSDPLNLYSSSISMEELHMLSLRLTAKHILYLVDAAYGGISRLGNEENVNLDYLHDLYGNDEMSDKVNKLLDELISKQEDYKATKTVQGYIGKITTERGRQIITAGGRGEQIIEKAEWGHSAFTKNLISGLYDGEADMNEDGFITADELGNYLRYKVSSDTESIQTPHLGRIGDDMGEFIFWVKENVEEIDSTKDISYEITIENIDSIMEIYNNDPMIFRNMDTNELVKFIQ